MHQGPCPTGATKIFPKDELVELLGSLQAPLFFKDFFYSLYWICYSIVSVFWVFFFFGPVACGILVTPTPPYPTSPHLTPPHPGIEPTPPALKGEVLTTGSLRSPTFRPFDSCFFITGLPKFGCETTLISSVCSKQWRVVEKQGLAVRSRFTTSSSVLLGRSFTIPQPQQPHL